MAAHICPVWVGYLLASPVRKLFQHPRDVVGDFVGGGDTVLDIGSAMGYFSIPMAKMVGERGKVVCIDLQEKMLRKLEKRALKAGVRERVETRRCTTESFGIADLAGQVDFALAFYVVHEAGEIPVMMKEVYEALKPGGRFLVAEPKGHVSAQAFDETVQAALAAGLKETDRPTMAKSRAALFQR